MSTSSNAKKWKFIIVQDNKGNEVKKIELDDRERQTEYKKRSKKRNFKGMKKKKFDIVSTVVFSRDVDNIEIEQNDYFFEENDIDDFMSFSEIPFNDLENAKM